MIKSLENRLTILYIVQLSVQPSHTTCTIIGENILNSFVVKKPPTHNQEL